MAIVDTISKSGHKITIEKPVYSTDDAGGRTSTWVTVYKNVLAWVQPASAGVRELFNERRLLVTNTVYVGRDLSIAEGHRVRFGSRTFVVVGIEDQGGLGRLFAIFCREAK